MSEHLMQVSNQNVETTHQSFKNAMEDAGGLFISSWQLIFRQSKVNNGAYDGDRLPTQNWNWPRGTWFQTRLRHLRGGRGQYTKLPKQSLQ